MTAVTVQQQHAVGETIGQRGIVQRGDDAGALAVEVAEHSQHLDLVQWIEVIAWLIEQVDLRRLYQQRRHSHAPLLAPRQSRHQALRELGQTETRERRVRDRQIVGPLTLPEAQVRMAADHDRFEHSHGERFLAILRQQAQLACHLASRQRSHIGTLQQHTAVARRSQPGERMQRQALAAAVAAENGQELPAGERHR